MAPSQQEDPPGNIGLRVVRSRRRAGAKPEGSKPKGESSHEEGHFSGTFCVQGPPSRGKDSGCSP